MAELDPVYIDSSNAYVDDFLRLRDENDAFVFVEFGHGSTPTTFNQPVPFTGDRAAIGIETWFHDMHGTAREVVQRMRENDTLDQNVFFIEHDLSGDIVFERLGATSSYEGVYNIRTQLPDAVASETFASNVFGDEHQADFPDRTARLLSEMSRLTETGGHVVIRETITPRHNQFLGQALFSQAGLRLESIVIPDDSSDWAKLETVYDADPAHTNTPLDSFYMLLRKQ